MRRAKHTYWLVIGLTAGVALGLVLARLACL